jgi:hypothetical protein
MADVAEAADKAEEEMMDAPPSKPVEPESKEETVTVSNGRRRGRRRVMKKRTVKDEEGYLGECHSIRIFSGIKLTDLQSQRRKQPGNRSQKKNR